MTTTLYDSTTASDIPLDAPAVAGYVDGLYANYGAMTLRFPGKPVVGITVLGAAGARVADVEAGDLTPERGASWAKREIANGRRPTLYYSLSAGTPVKTALVNLGVNPADVDYWVADWTGKPHMALGAVATQYADPATSGGHYDLSLALEQWLEPSIVPGPAPSPAPAPPQPPAGFMPPTLSPGALSGAVRNAQRLLNVHGAGLVIDGVFGPHTETAVRHFQTIFHLAVDGIIGPATWTALDTFG